MIVTPSPISFSILLFERGEIPILPMVLSYPYPIGPIFVAVPFMIIIVALVVIGPMIFGSQRSRHHRWSK